MDPVANLKQFNRINHDHCLCLECSSICALVAVEIRHVLIASSAQQNPIQLQLIIYPLVYLLWQNLRFYQYVLSVLVISNITLSYMTCCKKCLQSTWLNR